MTILREVNGIRFAETRRGDTLQAIALRELGTAERWPELIGLNNLVPPFLVDDVNDLTTGVLLTGRMIKIPAASQEVQTRDPDLVFERDVQLTAGGDLVANGGDLGLAAGRDNLRQALSNRLVTERGELMFHPEYGSLLRRIVGAVGGPTASLLAASYAKTAVATDPRIQRVTRARSTVSGDRIQVDVEAEPISGRTIQISEGI